MLRGTTGTSLRRRSSGDYNFPITHIKAPELEGMVVALVACQVSY